MDPLVTPIWVASRMREQQITLLDATLPMPGVNPAPDTQASYLAAHLPGAVFFDIEKLSDPESSLPHMLPTPERFGAAMEDLGVSSDATLVVYEQGNVFSAPRARWMLRSMGAKGVYLLDGGLQAWVAAGLPVETGPVRHEKGSFEATLHATAVKNFEAIQQQLESPRDAGHILDARSVARFRGIAPEPRPGIRSGHMPGSTSLPYTEVTHGGRMLPESELRALFEDRHIDLRKPITTTCGSGVTAAVIALAAELCGAGQVSLYDGSWAEYAQRPEAVIEDPSQL